MKEPAIKVIAKPRDTNPHGDMFGGWIVSMMDLAGAIAARKVTRTNIVTVAIDNIIFHNPVFVGDCLECFTEVEKVGRTSITIKVEAYVERKDRTSDDEKVKVTEGKFIFVAIDENRRPTAIAKKNIPNS